MVQGDGLVIVVLRPRFFRLRRRIQFFSSRALPPTFCFVRFSRSFILARSRHVILCLRLHRGPAHAEVSRKLSDCSKLRRSSQMVACFAILAPQTKMSFAIQSECRVFSFARSEGCLSE